MKFIFVFLLFLFSLGLSAQVKPELRQKNYPNGNIMYKGMFQNEKPIGLMERYYPTGVIKARMNYNGSYVESKLYNESGELVAQGRYIGQQKDSLWLYFKKNVIVNKELYSKGIKLSDNYDLNKDEGKIIVDPENYIDEPNEYLKKLKEQNKK